MKKNKITIILTILLVLAILLLFGIIGYDFYQGKKINDNVEDVLKQIDEKIVINMSELENKKEVVQNTSENAQENNKTAVINNAVVYGKIEISSAKIKYPILEYNTQNLKKNICNISGNDINGKGNLCLAGHNTSNGSLFGRLKRVKCGDVVEVTNLYGENYKYIVYSIVVAEPDDNSLLKPSDKSIITLVTCTNSGKQRLVVQGQLLSENK